MLALSLALPSAPVVEPAPAGAGGSGGTLTTEAGATLTTEAGAALTTES